MNTNWLVAILIILLGVDFLYRLQVDNLSQPRRPWTIPTPLLLISGLTSLFCLGLAWRYYVGYQDPDGSFMDGWLPIVLIILAVAIAFGFIESWQISETFRKPILDPYLLLETTAPVEHEFSQFGAERYKRLIRRGTILVTSLLIGWSLTSYLVASPEASLDTVFFPAERVRPIPTSAPSEVLLSADGLAEASTSDAVMTAPTAMLSQPESTGAGATAETLAIGGPLSETPIETMVSEVVDLSPQPGVLIDTFENETYFVVVQARLGVKARHTPTTTADVLTVLAYGDRAIAVARTSNNEWIQVALTDGVTAWIFANVTEPMLLDQDGRLAAIEILPIIDIVP